jgi:hypothetical protein
MTAWRDWVADRRRAGVVVAALLTEVPFAGAALIAGATVAGLLALGVMGALAHLVTVSRAADGALAVAVLAVFLLLETAARAWTGRQATRCERLLNAALCERVITAVQRPTGIDQYHTAELAAARGVGIRREPKPGAAVPPIAAWWTSTARRIGAAALLLPGGWWTPVIAVLGWRLIAPGFTVSGFTRTRRAGLAVIGVAALALVLIVIARDPSAGTAWRIVRAQAVLALAIEPGATLSRVREVLRSGASLARAVGRLPAAHSPAALPPAADPPAAPLPAAHPPAAPRLAAHPPAALPPPPAPFRRLSVGSVCLPAGRVNLAPPGCALAFTGLTSDDVLVDGVRLRELDLALWWRTVGIVPARPIRLPSTLLDNLSLGCGGASSLGTRWAADVVGLDGLAERLPAGRQTVLTSDLSGGVDLDAAGWRRIALFRALVRVAGGARLLLVEDAGKRDELAAEAACRAYPGLTVVLSHDGVGGDGAGR